MRLEEFKASPAAVLPLTLFQCLAWGLLDLPLTYLFRDIRCHEHHELAELKTKAIAPDDCHSPAIQIAYAADIALYFTIFSAISIIVSGPLGKLADTRGRKFALGYCASINCLSDIWLCSVGGGIDIIQTAFIADTATPASRSFYLGLGTFIFWVATAGTQLVSSILLDKGRFTINFVMAVINWLIYLVCLKFMLKETRKPKVMIADAKSPWAPSVIVHSVIEPLHIILVDSTLRWMGIVWFLFFIALNGLNFLVPYCDHVFRTIPSESGIITSVYSVSRATALVTVLPAYIWLYRRFFASKAKFSPSASHERIPLASANTDRLDDELDEELDRPVEDIMSSSDHSASAAQELAIFRVSMLFDSFGMFTVPIARNLREINAATILGSFGSPGFPAFQSLIAMGSKPEEMGRVLAGFSVLQGISSIVRGPLLAWINSATLETHPAALWAFCGSLFLLCGGLMSLLRSDRFVGNVKPWINT